MIDNVTYKNADRILGAAYTYLDPIVALRRARSSNRRITEFSLTHTDSFIGTQDENFCSVLLRNYRTVYPNDYSSDQIELQLNDLEQQIKSHYPKQDDLMGLFPIISGQLFTLKYGTIRVCFDRIFDWIGYINKLDLNVFMGAFMAVERIEPSDEFNWYPEIDNERLKRQLASEIGLAENHAHMKAAGYILEISWLKFIHSSITSQSDLDYIKSYGLGKLNDVYPEQKLRAFLRSVRFLRILLDTYVGHNPKYYEAKIKSQNSGLNQDADSKQKSDLKRTVSLECFADLKDFREFLYKQAISLKLTNDRVKESQQLFEYAHKRQNSNSEYIWEKEIIGEQIFWKKCFESYLSTEKDNPFFRRILNLYLVCSNYVKHSLIQSNRGSGFDRFTDAENLKSVFLGNDSKAIHANLESVFKKYLQSGPVTKLELRISPKVSADEYVAQIKELKEAYERVSGKPLANVDKCATQIQKLNSVYRNLNGKTLDELVTQTKKIGKVSKSLSNQMFGEMRIGLIIHFIKEHRKQVNENQSRRNFYADYQQAIMRQSQTLQLFMTSPKYRSYQKYVVGIDTANLERENPPELFGDVYRMGYALKKQHNFHFTYHVGESYNTLMDGLRHIFEVVFRLNFSNGDRLGHALALGQDVNHYYTVKRNVVITDRQSFLDDIAWIYWMIKQDSNADKGDLAYLNELFNESSMWFEEIFENILTLHDYVDFYCLRGTNFEYLLNDVYHVNMLKNLSDIKLIKADRRKQIRARFDQQFIDVTSSEICNAVFNVNAMRLYACYELNPEVFKRGREPITVLVTPILLQLIEDTQKNLCSYLMKKNVFIEANPSSNTKISIAKHYEDLQFLKLNQYGLLPDDTVDFPLSINTDDSAIFQTMLPYEYALIGKALIDSGNNVERVYAYLAYLQKASVEQSFIEDDV